MAARHLFRSPPTNAEARLSRTGLHRTGECAASYAGVGRRSDFARAAHTDHGCRVTAKMLQVSIAEMIAQKPYACEIFGRALQVGQPRAMCESPEFHYPNRRNVRRRCTSAPAWGGAFASGNPSTNSTVVCSGPWVLGAHLSKRSPRNVISRCYIDQLSRRSRHLAFVR